MTEALFITYGTLRLKLYEVIDAFQDNDNYKSKYDGIWINVTLYNKIKEKVCSFSAEGILINGNDKFLIDEEFTFDDVSSAHYLIFTIFTTYDNTNDIDYKDDIKGSNKIISNSFSRITRFRKSNDNLKNTSNVNIYNDNIDKEIHYIGAIEIPINRLEEHVPINQWYQFKSLKTNEGLRAAIRTELLFIKRSFVNSDSNLTIDTTYDKGNVTGDSIHKTDSNEIDSSPVAILIDNDNISNLFGSDMITENKTIIDAFRIGDDDDDAYDEQLPSGLIDYCLILGPNECNQENLKHAISNYEILNKEQYQASLWTRTNQLSPTAGSDCSPLFESNVKLWDRYPLQDRPDKGLPSRIEWFACPEGSLITVAKTRPSPIISTFILSSGDDADDFYGICLYFALDSGIIDNKDDSDSLPHYDEFVDIDNQWWADRLLNVKESKLSANSSSDKSRVWIGIRLCILTQQHYVNELSKVLNILYESTIKQNIQTWEESRDSSSLIEWHSLNMGCEFLMGKLLNYCPVPLPGIFSISCGFRGLNDNIVSFQPPSLAELPTCAYPVESLLSTLGPRATVDLITFALSECKILFHSTTLNKLPGICEALRTLLYPLRWPPVYIPIVPAPLLDLVEAPVPFILGTHSHWLKFIPESCLQDVIIINLDNASIDMTDSNPIKFPDTIDRWLIYGMKSILFNSHDGEISEAAASNNRGKQLQLLVYDVMFNLFRGVPSCLFYLGPDIPVFNRTIFLANHASNFCKQYLDAITDSTSFHQFSESINSPFLSFFRQCIEDQPRHKASNHSEARNINGAYPFHMNNYDYNAVSCLLPDWILENRINDSGNIDLEELFQKQIRKYLNYSRSAKIPELFIDCDDHKLSMLPNNIIVDEISDSSLKPFVAFDHRIIEHVDNFANWTLNTLCEELGVDLGLQEENYVEQSPLSHSKKKILSAMKSNKDLSVSKKENINHAFENFTSGMGNALVQYLQRVLSGDEISDRDEKSLLDDCKNLLMSSYYRENLISILKQGKAGEQNDDIKRISTEINVPSSAFEALSKLFAVVIEACVLTDDFVSAYDLLECGGQYCHQIDINLEHRVRDRKNSIVSFRDNRGSIFSAEKATEFLSGRFRNHPIFQSIKLWKANLDKRLVNIKQMPQEKLNEEETDDDNNDRKITSEEIIREIHSLLYVMVNVGINRERANLFIETVTADYAIKDSLFFELSRFVNRLWPRQK